MANSKSAAKKAPADFVFKEPGEDPLYDAWFREQVQLGLEAVARGETVTHEAVTARWRRQRAELLRRARGT
ncbi:MAG: hypothetical protein ACRED5_21865 [Propylenella sp.]